MRHVLEPDVVGDRAPHPHSRVLKHLIAPWTVGSRGLWVGMSKIDPGSSSNPHSHPNEEVFFVVSGSGEVRVGDEREAIGPGSAVLIPPNEVHRLFAGEGETLEVLCCASPPFTKGDFDRWHQLDDEDAPSV